MIAGAAAAQMVKEQMEDSSRVAGVEARPRAGEPAREPRRRRVRSGAAAALRAAAERLEPAARAPSGVARRAM